MSLCLADAAPRLAKNVFEDERIGTESYVERRGRTTGRVGIRSKSKKQARVETS